MFGEWRVKAVPKALQCPYNAWVKCPEKMKCEQCGWNPIVEEKRKEQRFGINLNK